jgi:hypothetical protein
VVLKVADGCLDAVTTLKRVVWRMRRQCIWEALERSFLGVRLFSPNQMVAVASRQTYNCVKLYPGGTRLLHELS